MFRGCGWLKYVNLPTILERVGAGEGCQMLEYIVFLTKLKELALVLSRTAHPCCMSEFHPVSN
eukprot:scaffold7759_cov62-Cylindrotheca_fusiformis.AAC.4